MRIIRYLSIFLTLILLLSILSACSGELSASGCRIISEDGNHVTYQQVCPTCGYEYGDPTTAHVSQKLMYSLTCTQCGGLIIVRIER